MSDVQRTISICWHSGWMGLRLPSAFEMPVDQFRKILHLLDQYWFYGRNRDEILVLQAFLAGHIDARLGDLELMIREHASDPSEQTLHAIKIRKARAEIKHLQKILIAVNATISKNT